MELLLVLGMLELVGFLFVCYYFVVVGGGFSEVEFSVKWFPQWSINIEKD